MSRSPLIVGNWKMNGLRDSAQALLAELRRGFLEPVRAQLAVCVPFPYLDLTRRSLSGSPISWGAQAVSEFEAGAHTGEVSAPMLRDFDCEYVLVGHSERRVANGETDAMIAMKTKASLRNNLTPIVCIGESLAEREGGDTEAVVLRQLSAAIGDLDTEQQSRCVIAYEPVWAIGTGLTATPSEAEEVHAAIRRRIADFSPAAADSVRILYGGSVKPSGSVSLFSQPNVDGGLIGGASLVAADFLAIAASINPRRVDSGTSLAGHASEKET